MDTFYILTNEKKDKGLHVTRLVQSYIEKSGKKSILAQTDEEGYVIPGSVPLEADCAIVIGGDGTLIQAIRGIRGSHLPVLGINMGTLGYLAEVEVTDIANDLNKLFEESYTLEYRMMMQGSVCLLYTSSDHLCGKSGDCESVAADGPSFPDDEDYELPDRRRVSDTIYRAVQKTDRLDSEDSGRCGCRDQYYTGDVDTGNGFPESNHTGQGRGSCLLYTSRCV